MCMLSVIGFQVTDMIQFSDRQTDKVPKENLQKSINFKARVILFVWFEVLSPSQQ